MDEEGIPSILRAFEDVLRLLSVSGGRCRLLSKLFVNAGAARRLSQIPHHQTSAHVISCGDRLGSELDHLFTTLFTSARTLYPQNHPYPSLLSTYPELKPHHEGQDTPAGYLWWGTGEGIVLRSLILYSRLGSLSRWCCHRLRLGRTHAKQEAIFAC